MNETPLIQARGLRRAYGETGTVEVLHGIDLAADRGEMIAIVGPSGSGKTTLLQILGTLDRPNQGEVRFRGRVVSDLPEARLAAHRNRNLGFIFQFHHLLPEFSALENVTMPGRIGGLARTEAESRARDLLERIGLGHRLNHRPGELSGGEQQRVALARALVMHPSLLLADEPTGNLDSESGSQVFALLRELCRSMDLCVIMVTHNLDLARAMDRSLTLIDGRIRENQP